MSQTLSLELNPNRWTIIGPLNLLHLIQVKDGKSIRLHFGDANNAPSVDTEDYIIMPEYNQRPFQIENLDGHYYDGACLFAQPNDNAVAKLTVVMLKRTSPILLPSDSRLTSVKVGHTTQRLIEFYGERSTLNVAMSLASGQLPPGMDLVEGNLIWSVRGTPSTPGDYAFKIRADYGSKYVEKTFQLAVATAS